MIRFRTLIAFVFCFYSVYSQSIVEKSGKDSNGKIFTYFENDPLQSRIYVLENGLTVFLNINKEEPRINSNIIVKAGSTYDPKDNTGLAHYLEHMMFKGSDKFGTLNWQKEEPLIAEISGLYEAHKQTTDTIKKKLIYKKIDSVSALAAQYAIANEYDKMVTELGAKNTNAYTSNEMTVYLNDIPANELDRYMMIEYERFRKIVLRLFHTELEAVYEEFNMSQDNDYRQGLYAFLNGLFPNHPYGSQTTIGKAEHLKNPSMEAIHQYWNTYYVPNNMAICLSGDLDFEQAITSIENTFGKLPKSENVPALSNIKERSITKPVVKEVFGPDEAFLFMGYRAPGANDADKYKLMLLSELLFNNDAGLMELNLNKSQKVMGAGGDIWMNKDYTTIIVMGKPRTNQELETVKDLIIEQIDAVKRGNFEDWMLKAIVNNLKLGRIKTYESNEIVEEFSTNFALNRNWTEYLNQIDEIEKITKEDIIAYANTLFKDNHVVVYKRTGKSGSNVKVQKPEITPIAINREDESKFVEQFRSIKTKAIATEFINFNEKLIEKSLTDNVSVKYIKNNTNELFSLYYVIEMGKQHDQLLSLAIDYLYYLGTSKYTNEQLTLELFKHGLSFNVSATDDNSYVSITGLSSGFDKGIELLEHIISDAQVNNDAYQNMVVDILKAREDAKLDKNSIMKGGLLNYAKYGKKSAFTSIISEDSLRNLDPKILVDKIKEIFSYNHDILYYGAMNVEDVKNKLTASHPLKEIKALPEKKEYPYLENANNIVYFVHYDMVQTNILLLSKKQIFDKNLLPQISLFNNYFGAGMSSIVFQELRESKALAYQAYSYLAGAKKQNDNNFLLAYIATSPDKISEALSSLLDLHTNFRKSPVLFDGAKQSILRQIETQRITKESIYFTYLNNKRLGIADDYRKMIYQQAQKLSLDDIEAYFNSNIKNSNFTYLVLGNRNDVDMNILSKIGTVKELSLEEIFGY
ncbi:MAG: insulinase family protein [Bacteroidales bacterium]|nr:insulinase family protein [Bacteroidales bacterium]